MKVGFKSLKFLGQHRSKALVLVLLFFLSFCELPLYSAKATGGSWLYGWNYRKSLVINNASGAGTNYQIRVTVHYGAGTENGEDVYLDGECRADFGDIRFTGSGGSVEEELYYWMETEVDLAFTNFISQFRSVSHQAYHYVGTYDRTYIAWINNTGSQYIGYFDHNSYSSVSQYIRTVGDDDHATPSVYVRSDGKILVFLPKETGHFEGVDLIISTNPEDIISFGAPITVGSASAAYPRIWQAKNGMLGVITRHSLGGRLIEQISYSYNGGETWTTPTSFVDYEVNRKQAYGLLYQELIDLDRLHYAGFYYDANALDRFGLWYMQSVDGGITWRKINGTTITLPANDTTMDEVWNIQTIRPLDIVADDITHTPYIVVAQPISAGSPHPIRRIRYEAGSWTREYITDSAWFYGTGNNTYTTGAAIDPRNPDKLYISVLNGNGGSDMQRWERIGGVWTKTLNMTAVAAFYCFRPQIPRNYHDDLAVLWGCGTSYTHYGEWTSNMFSWGKKAVFWVKITDDLSTTAQTIYIYYGKADATTTSNIAATFIRVIDGNQSVKLALSMDEGGGILNYDQSGAGNHGTLKYSPTWVDGRFGKALSFNGVNDYVSTPLRGTHITTGNVTIAFWATGRKGGELEGFLGSMEDAPDQDRFLVRLEIATNNIRFSIGDLTTCVTTTEPYVPAAWNWIVATYNGTHATLYVNGTLIIRVAGVAGDFSNELTRIGEYRLVTTHYCFEGIIDEVFISTQPWTQDEITDLNNNYGYATPNYAGSILVRKRVSPEPSHGAWGNEEPALTIGEFQAPSTVSTNSYFMLNATIQDLNGVAGIVNATIEISNSVVLKWVASTNTFSEQSDPNGYCTLDASGSVRTAVNSTAYKLSWKIKLGWMFPEGYVSVLSANTKVFDSTGESGSGSASNLFYCKREIPVGGPEDYTWNPFDLFVQYLKMKNFVGFITAVYSSILGEAFFGILILILSIPLYLRTQSLTYVCFLWLILGATLAYFLPVGARNVAYLFIVISISGLLYRLFTRDKD